MSLTGRDPTKISVHVLENLANGQSNVTTLTIQELADAFLQQKKQLEDLQQVNVSETEQVDSANSVREQLEDALTISVGIVHDLKTELATNQDALAKAASRIVELEDALKARVVVPGVQVAK